MNKAIVWNDIWSMGQADLDRQHRHIIDIANQLRGATDTDPQAVKSALVEVLNHTLEHFSAEEEFLASHSTVDSAEHIRQHRMIRDSAEAVFADSALITPELVNDLLDTIVHHVKVMDQLH